MQDGLTMRPARDDERVFLMRLMISAIRSYCVEAYGRETVDAWTNESTSRFDFRIPEQSFVAEIDGRVVAFAGWQPEEGEPGLARVTAAFVAPGMDRRGLARAVMACVEQNVAESGFGRTHLYATLNAVPFYFSMGYQETARQDTEVAEGHMIELVQMTRDGETAPEESP